MNIPGNYVVDFCYTLWIFISIYFYYSGIYVTNLDYVLGILAIVVGILIVPLRNHIHIIYGHTLNTIYLAIVSFFSHNIYLLGLNILMLFNIIVSRLVFHDCLFIKMRRSETATPASITITNMFNKLNGSYIYPTLLITSIYRLYKTINPNKLHKT